MLIIRTNSTEDAWTLRKDASAKRHDIIFYMILSAAQDDRDSTIPSFTTGMRRVVSWYNLLLVLFIFYLSFILIKKKLIAV